MNVGPYVPLPHRAAERRCYLKYIAVDGAPIFLCISCPWSPVSGPERGNVDDDRCPGLAGMAPASEVVAAEVSGFISFSHSVAVVSVFSSLSLVLLCP